MAKTKLELVKVILDNPGSVAEIGDDWYLYGMDNKELACSYDYECDIIDAVTHIAGVRFVMIG